MQSQARGVFIVYLIWLVKKERWDRNKYWDDANGTKLRGIVSDQGKFEARLFLRTNHTGSWMSVRRTTVTGTVRAATKFRVFLCASNNVNPPYI